jgi:hypothetical protein
VEKSFFRKKSFFGNFFGKKFFRTKLLQKKFCKGGFSAKVDFWQRWIFGGCCMDSIWTMLFLHGIVVHLQIPSAKQFLQRWIFGKGGFSVDVV